MTGLVFIEEFPIGEDKRSSSAPRKQSTHLPFATATLAPDIQALRSGPSETAQPCSSEPKVNRGALCCCEVVTDPAHLEMVPERLSREDNFHDKIPPQTRMCAWLRKWQQLIERNQLNNIKQNYRSPRLGHDLRESIRVCVNQWLCLNASQELRRSFPLGR
jgi:hypothetical protein